MIGFQPSKSIGTERVATECNQKRKGRRGSWNKLEHKKEGGMAEPNKTEPKKKKGPNLKNLKRLCAPARGGSR